MDPNALASLQVRMRLDTEPLVQKSTNPREFLFRHGYWPPCKTHQTRDARNLQHSQSVLQRQMDKNIPWKERHLQPHFAVFPLAHGFVFRQEIFHAALRKL